MERVWQIFAMLFVTVLICIVDFIRVDWNFHNVYGQDQTPFRGGQVKSPQQHLFLLNKDNLKYHKQNCEYGRIIKKSMFIAKAEIKPNYIPCAYCIKKSKVKQKHVVRNFDAHSGNLSMLFLDFTSTQKPSKSCLTSSCKLLLKSINDSENSIDFAIYGIEDMPVIFDALVKAQKRGVLVRWVTDGDAKGVNIYSDTQNLMQVLPNVKVDHVLKGNELEFKKPRSFKSAIMHNKFFVFDGKAVWTSSANVTDTDLSGYSANNTLFINSKFAADVYLKEFGDMYSGLFHVLKPKTVNNENINVDDKTTISIYFSPNDSVITDKILPLLDRATRRVYVSAFYLTHQEFCEKLVELHKRGVKILVIVDATSAANPVSKHKLLRDVGIQVKVENLAGKMHSKTIVVDDEITVLGSMNFSKNGEVLNDENVVFVTNKEMAKANVDIFEYYWKFISDKWLMKNPSAEGISSIGSCSDGVDNDYDGKIDLNDAGCHFKKRKAK